jgi:hypothetical protein
MAKKKDEGEFGNRFVRVIGLIGFIIATVGFLLALTGVGHNGGSEAGTAMFNSFIMCTALAFAAILVTTMGHISETLKSIEHLLSEQNKSLGAKGKK